jgi:hypothetical protein
MNYKERLAQISAEIEREDITAEELELLELQALTIRSHLLLELQE